MVLMDLGSFYTFSIIFPCEKKHPFWGIFDQKAWTIAHGFDGFGVDFENP
jgi:hypothetical protein